MPEPDLEQRREAFLVGRFLVTGQRPGAGIVDARLALVVAAVDELAAYCPLCDGGPRLQAGHMAELLASLEHVDPRGDWPAFVTWLVDSWGTTWDAVVRRVAIELVAQDVHDETALLDQIGDELADVLERAGDAIEDHRSTCDHAETMFREAARGS